MERINSQERANALASTKQMRDESALATVTTENPHFRAGAAIFAIGVFKRFSLVTFPCTLNDERKHRPKPEISPCATKFCFLEVT